MWRSGNAHDKIAWKSSDMANYAVGKQKEGGGDKRWDCTTIKKLYV